MPRRQKYQEPMTTLEQIRWNEIQFFYLMYEVQELRNNPDDIRVYVELLEPFGKFSVLTVLAIVREYLNAPYTHPCRDEVILLGNKAGIPWKKLQSIIPVSNQTYYTILKQPELLQGVRPRLPRDRQPHIEKFLEAHQRLRGIGLYARYTDD